MLASETNDINSHCKSKMLCSGFNTFNDWSSIILQVEDHEWKTGAEHHFTGHTFVQ